MKTEDLYTVVGIWPDSEQRWMDSVYAESGDAAARKVNSYYPGLIVAGVIHGDHQAEDTQPYM